MTQNDQHIETCAIWILLTLLITSSSTRGANSVDRKIYSLWYYEFTISWQERQLNVIMSYIIFTSYLTVVYQLRHKPNK